MQSRTRKLLLLAALAAISAPSPILFAGFYYSGMTEFSQPNAVTFQACRWGDEFSWEQETDAGYTIIQNRSDGYWYYAVLDSTGDYIPGNLKVAIDAPNGVPLHLRRTEPILSAIQEAVETNDINLEEQRAWYEDHHLAPYNELHLGVILVEFLDFEEAPLLARRVPGNPNEPYYSFADFDDALNSTDSYLCPRAGGNQYSPDGGEVWGSFRDYWREVSGYWTAGTEIRSAKKGFHQLSSRFCHQIPILSTSRQPLPSLCQMRAT